MVPTPTDGRPGRGRGVLENSAINLMGLVAGSLFGVASGWITARVLGPAGVGVLAVVFGLIEFGRGLTNFTHNPSILEVHRGRDPGAVWGTSLVLKFVGALVFVALVASLSPLLAETFRVPAVAIILTSFLLVVGAFQEVGTARWEAENRMVQRNLLVASGPFVGFLAVLAFVAAGRYDVYAAVLTSIIGTTAMSLGFLSVWPDARAMRYDGAVASYLIRYGSRLVAATFLTQALLWTDTLMVSGILGNASAGVYNVVFQITFVMVTASTAVGVALLPAMSELRGRGEDTSLAYHRGTLLALGLSLLLAAVLAPAGPLILRLYGPGFEGGYPALLVLLLFGVTAASSVPAQSMMMVHDRAGTLTLLSFAMAAVNIPVNYLLIGKLGILGASIATTVVFALGMLATWTIVHRTTGAWPLSRSTFAEARTVPARLARRLRRR